MLAAMRLLRLPLLALALALTAFAPPPAAPDETPAWARAYLGTWSLYEDGEGAPACTLRFVRGMAIGGAAIALSATCRRNFPLEEVAGWTLSDPRKGRPSILFIDALRKPVFTFAPGPDRSWQATLPDRDGLTRGGFLLERGKPDTPASLKAMFSGDESFDLSGPNNAQWCGFTTTATSAAGGALRQQGQCARRWKGRGWAAWAFEGGELKLKDRKGGVIVSLKRADALTFQADTPEGPLFFGPGVVVDP